MDDTPRLLPLNYIAHQLSVPVKWLYAEAEAGRIPCLRAGKAIVANLEAVESALLKRENVLVCNAARIQPPGEALAR